LYTKLYERARIRWGYNFARSYNSFFGLNAEEGEFLNESSKAKKTNRLKPLKLLNSAHIDDSLEEKARRMHEITQKVRQVKGLGSMQESDFFDQMKKILDKEHEFDTFESQR